MRARICDACGTAEPSPGKEEQYPSNFFRVTHPAWGDMTNKDFCSIECIETYETDPIFDEQKRKPSMNTGPR